MAESLDDGEFWLPPQFLADDDLFSEKRSNDTLDKKVPSGDGGVKDVFPSEATQFSKDIFPLEFPYGFDTYSGVSSDLSSPVDSVVGSAEESEEDELLTCRLARSSKATVGGNENKKGWAVSGSPQSTLCGVGSGCRCKKLSSDGSPNECSPAPATWDLLHAAAGEVARIRMDEEGCVLNRHSTGILGQPQQQQRKTTSPVAVYMKNSNSDLGFLRPQSLAYQKLQASQFHHMKQQQMIKQQQGTESAAWGGQSKGAAAALFPQQQQAQPVIQARGRNMGRPVGLNPSVWPPIQQAQAQAQAQHQHRQVGPGMRAVFLGGNNRGAKRECAGTGVFLPRQIGTESRKKTASSTTVLLPAKVVQALKLDDGGHLPTQIHQQRLNGTFHPARENVVRSRNCNVQKRNLVIRPQQEIEVRLPQEWTY